MNHRWRSTVSPPITALSESDVADLFGPDDGFVDDRPEPAVPSRDVVDGGEFRVDDDDVAAGSDEPNLVQAPAGLPSLHFNPLPRRLLSIG